MDAALLQARTPHEPPKTLFEFERGAITFDKRQQGLRRAAAMIAEDDAGGDDDGQDEQRGVRALSYRQDVAIGVPMTVQLEINGTDAQAGMLLAALDRRLPEGVGGRSALGYGRLSGALYLRVQGGKREKVAVVRGGVMTLEAHARPYIEAMSEAVSRLTKDDIEKFMVAARDTAEGRKKENATS